MIRTVVMSAPLIRGRSWSALFLILLLFTGCAVNSPPEARRGKLDLSAWDFKKDGPVQLRGEWEFHWKRLYTPENFPRQSQGAKAPPLIRVPSSWNHFRHEGRAIGSAGYATMRLRVTLPAEGDFALKIYNQATSHRLYVDGRLVSVAGVVGRTKEESRPQFFTHVVELSELKKRREIEFIVQIANFTHRRGGMWWPFRLGTAEQTHFRTEGSLVLDILLAGTMLIIGLYHIAFYILRKSSTDAAYFGLFCLVLSVRAVFYGERYILRLFPDISFEAVLVVEYLTFFLSAPLFTMYFRAVFPAELPRLVVRIAQGLAFVLCVFVLVTPPAIYTYTAPVYQVFVGYLFLHMFVSAIIALRRRRQGAGLYLTGMLIIFIAFTNDILYMNFLSSIDLLTPFGMLVFVFAQALLLARKYSGAFRQVETLSGELESRNRELVRLDRLKDAFLANTSHELRTPLQGIIGMADAMRDDGEQALTPASRKRLELIMASGRRLSRLVGDILDFSRLRYRDVRLNVGTVHLRSLVQLQIELMSHNRPADRPVELINDVPGELPPVRADEERLTQVLQNLLSNALKFTRDGEIRVSARAPAGDMIEIAVSDTGPGISPGDRERIFEPFEQVEGTSGGTGLGLSIARSLVELQGGRFQLDENYRHGARFKFTLPAAEAPSILEEDPGGRPLETLLPMIDDAGETMPGNTESGRHRNGARILVVDDEPVNLEVMRSYLQAMEASVETAADATGARMALAHEPLPDCLVLDIMMPGISGLELTRQLRSEHSRAELPILMVTAKTRTSDLMAALDAGANDYLTKPFEKKEFLYRVENLMELSRSHRDSESKHDAVKNAAQRERARINADLHDHLGASLTDLKLFSETARNNPAVDEYFARRLEDKVEGALRVLRNDLLSLEDLSLLEEDFMAGIHMIILRRYVEADRVMDFHAPEEGREDLARRLGRGHVSILYAVLKEMATNDLKYGVGQTTWVFSWDENEIRLDFQAYSRYHLAGHGTGRGTAGMVRRLAEIGGSLKMSIAEDGADERLIEIKIRVPMTDRFAAI